MRFDIITIFPQFFEGFLSHGIVRRALVDQRISVFIHDLREFTTDKYRTVDDRPFGGSQGMVLKPEPIFRAVELAIHPNSVEQLKSEKDSSVAIALLSAQGKTFHQSAGASLSSKKQIVLICGRYEGVDERVVSHLITEEISVGDYILSGGEVAAMTVIDVITRLLPDTLGNSNSALNESFVNGRLDYPVWTRPAIYRGYNVPEELLTGNHQEIELWRRRKALEKTKLHRPDLLLKNVELLDPIDQKILLDLNKKEKGERDILLN